MRSSPNGKSFRPILYGFAIEVLPVCPIRFVYESNVKNKLVRGGQVEMMTYGCQDDSPLVIDVTN